MTGKIPDGGGERDVKWKPRVGDAKRAKEAMEAREAGYTVKFNEDDKKAAEAANGDNSQTLPGTQTGSAEHPNPPAKELERARAWLHKLGGKLKLRTSYDEESLAAEFTAIFERGRRQGREEAAQVIDREIHDREQFDSYMEPLDVIARRIRGLRAATGESGK
jgi:hypothetical protein